MIADDDLSASGSPIGLAPLATVERYHTEYKARFVSLEERTHQLELDRAVRTERFAHIEYQLDEIKKMLSDDAKRREGPRWWIMVGVVVAVVLPLLSWAFVAGRYPDRSDFQSVSARVVQLEAETRVQKVLLDTFVFRRQNGAP